MRRSRLIPTALLLVVAACAAHNRADDMGAPRRQRNIISITEIQEGETAGISNVLDLIIRLHPEWLRVTPSSTSGAGTPVSGWVDNQHIGTVQALRSVPLRSITQIRYLTASEAQGELGLNNQGGAVLVSTR